LCNHLACPRLLILFFARHRLLALVIIASLLAQIAVPISSQADSHGITSRNKAGGPFSFTDSLGSALGMILSSMSEGDEDAMPDSYEMPSSNPPVDPPTPAQLESSVERVEIKPDGAIIVPPNQLGVIGIVALQLNQTVNMMAIPIDSEGNAVNGVAPQWSSSNPLIVSITSDGEATANQLGTALLTATAGSHTSVMQATVQDSQPSSPSTAPPPGDTLPDDETNSMYTPANSVGTPPGRATPGAATPAVAANATERPGSANFTFGVPLLDLPGRGIDLSLGLAYNSRLWNKSSKTTVDGDTTYMTYDVDSGWPAPGFRLGYGHLESQGSAGFTLTDPDGTRHQLTEPSPNTYTYESKDGTFIQYSAATHIITYTDGTQVRYSAAGGGKRSYPTKITDRNGNFILISYVDGVGPKIDTVQDTLARVVRFYYDSNGDLSSITAPTYSNQLGSGCVPARSGCRERTVVRFFYTNRAVNGHFSADIVARYPSPVTRRVLQYIYFPETGAFPNEGSGYSFSYSTYGMIYRITQSRRMVLSSDGTTVSSQKVAAWTEYNYQGTPLTPEPAGGLTDAPFYTKRTDEWAGRTTSGAPPFYTFAVDEAQGLSQITAPDGSMTQTSTIVASGQFTHGLIKDTVVKDGANGAVLAKVAYTWDTSVSSNQRLLRVDETNDAGQTRATVYHLYDEFNNILDMNEHDFGAAGGSAGAELRRTKTTYERRASYWNKRLVHLPTRVEVYQGGTSTLLSMVNYAYDTSTPTGYSDIKMHNVTYNPSSNGYQSTTIYRGNLTRTTSYPDVTDTTNTIIDTATYDCAGNVRTATASCCQKKAFSYTVAYQYAYVERETRGSSGQVSTSAVYDRNTGLIRSTVDENAQVTTIDYWPQSLRPSQTTSPDGSWTKTVYDDRLYATPSATYSHSVIVTHTGPANSDGGDVTSYQYLDGRGAVTRTLVDNTAQGYSTTDLAYDNMGRILKASNPYQTAYTARSTQAVTPADGLWTVRAYDRLGRVTSITLPGNAGVATNLYNGKTSTVTDQAGRQRRQTVDGLGRIVQLDEPNVSGSLGAIGAATQPTNYQYDALGNLLKITQGTQRRYFKYDSLSRLIYDRQPEKGAPYTATDAATGNNAWSNKFSYTDDGLLEDVYDARQIHAHYTYDSLNRMRTITYSGETTTTASGTPIRTPNVTLTYDEFNSDYYNYARLTKVETRQQGASTPETVQTYDYDLMGRVQRQQQTVGGVTYTLAYSYNALGQLLTETYPSGRVVTFDYNNGSHLSGIHDNATTYVSALTYGAHGGLMSETYGNGAAHTFSYNALLQLSSASLTKNNAVIQRYDYKYGVADMATGAVDETKNTGQIATIEGFIGGAPSAPVKQWQQRFAYDYSSRLTTGAEYRGDDLTRQSYTQTYTYDRYGNRYQYAAQNGVGAQENPQPYTRVEATEIDQATNRYKPPTGTTALVTYDAAGQIITDDKFRAMQYRYDANGRQRWAQSTQSATPEVSAIYDGLGQRVATKLNANPWLYMIYDINGQLVAEYPNGTLDREYIYRGGQIVARIKATGPVRYVMQDHQGSTRVVMDETGAVLTRHDYLAFGDEIQVGTGMRTSTQGYGAVDSNQQRYAMLEQDYDEASGQGTGLDHAWWRKYDSEAGRWTSPDPYTGSMSIGDPQTFNRYSYTQNDPVNSIDPSGLEEPLVCYVDGIPQPNCALAFSFLNTGVGVVGPLQTDRYNNERHTWERYQFNSFGAGYVPLGANSLGNGYWSWTDWAHPNEDGDPPSYTYAPADRPIIGSNGQLTFWDMVFTQSRERGGSVPQQTRQQRKPMPTRGGIRLGRLLDCLNAAKTWYSREQESEKRGFNALFTSREALATSAITFVLGGPWGLLGQLGGRALVGSSIGIGRQIGAAQGYRMLVDNCNRMWGSR
jgi:RHS repeat-associated protein